jgi:thioredoxin reductase (NADPH)
VQSVESSFDIVVIGGGIAGLSAGLTSARLGARTLVLTGPALGGHLLSIDCVEGYPGHPEGIAGYELCPTVQSQAAEAGAEFAMSDASAIEPADDGWIVTAASGSYSAAAVIVATGTALVELGVPGESVLRGRGVSHCASCDAPLLRGERVLVVGGGDSALQEALRLAEDVREVIVLHRGESPIAQAAFRHRVSACENISLRPYSEVEEILGEEAVSGARVRDTSEGGATDLEAAGVFVYIGHAPNTELVGSALALSASRHIPTDASMRTDARGLLAAGTVREGAVGRAVASAGDGSAAAIAAHRYLENGSWRSD